MVFNFSEGRGQRQAGFRFRLLEGSTLRPLGDIHPIQDSPPRLTHSASGGAVTRTLSMSLGEEDAERVNFASDRVAVEMLLGGDTYLLGQYLFSDDVSQDFWDGAADRVRSLESLQLTDQMAIVDTQLETAFTANLEQAHLTIERLLLGLGIIGVYEESPIEINNSWTAGTSRRQVLQTVADLGGFLAPWFDNEGQFRLLRQFDLNAGPADFDFDELQTVFAESVTRSDAIAYTPNRVVVIANGGINYGATLNEAVDPGPISAFCDVASTAPHSIMNLGFVRPEVVEMQVTSNAQAQAVADLLCLRQTIPETVEVSTILDPRHDGWNTVQFQGQRWLEQGWTMELTAGGVMRHTLQRLYPATPEVLSGVAGAIVTE